MYSRHKYKYGNARYLLTSILSFGLAKRQNNGGRKRGSDINVRCRLASTKVTRQPFLILLGDRSAPCPGLRLVQVPSLSGLVVLEFADPHLARQYAM